MQNIKRRMSNPTISINKWREVFENANSRKLMQLKFYMAPAGCSSSGYIELLTEYGEEGLMAYGAFHSLCQLMATRPKEHRGSFLKSSGEPMSVRQISMLIHIDEKLLNKCLELLMLKSVAWVSTDEIPNESQNDSKEIPSKSQSSAKKKTPKSVPIAWTAKDGFTGITDDDLKEWKETYPACDVPRQLKQMNQWLLSEPARSKKKLWRKFITNWLGRSQERGGDLRGGPSAKKTTHRPDKQKVSRLMFETAYEKAFPPEKFPKLYPMDDSMNYWGLSVEHQHKLAEAHPPLKKHLNK